MSNYYEALLKDMPWQFQDKEKIQVLVEAFADQLDEVYEFLADLNISRRLENAVGTQLDMIGDIVCLTRAQAGLLTGDPITIDVLDDETYRTYLKYKILLNTSDCTYKDLMVGLRMFVDDVITYEEDVNRPATIILKGSNEVTTKLLSLPITRAAGVGIYIQENEQKANVSVNMAMAILYEDIQRIFWNNIDPEREDIVFFNTSSVSPTSSTLLNKNNSPTLTVQVSGAGQTPIAFKLYGMLDDEANEYIELSAISNSFATKSSITSNGVYSVPVLGISKIKAVCTTGLGSFKAYGILKEVS